jgi:hypothetical protein
VVNLKEYRTLFFVATLVLALIAASPTIAMLMPSLSSSEKLSELWLLDSNHATEDYPFNVTDGEMYNVFVGVGNRMGSSGYYKVYVKFGNLTQLDFSSSESSSLPTLYELQGFAGDRSFWESPVTFGFQNVSLVYNVTSMDNATMNATVEDSVLSVDNIIINEMVFPVDAQTSWDEENRGFYFRLSFELWRYDTEYDDFRFDSLFVGLRLNMTSSSVAEVL